MATIRKTITFTDKQDKWIKAQIEAGELTSDSGYLSYLVRKDQAKNSQFMSLKAAIQIGIASGVSESNIPDIMKEVEELMKADGHL